MTPGDQPPGRREPHLDLPQRRAGGRTSRTARHRVAHRLAFDQDCYGWFAAEHEPARQLRDHWRKTLSYGRDHLRWWRAIGVAAKAG